MKITAENLQKNFVLDHGMEVHALKGVDLEIRSGESVAIMGPSGAGKSTLLHLLGLMDRPSGGKLLIDGLDVAAQGEREYARTRSERIGFMFQLHYLLPEFTVWENVLIPIWERRTEKKKDAAVLLERLGLAARTGHLPSELSGGEQQRVALARALVHGPGLLMADEPTGNLDRETGENVESVIFSECRQRKITLIIVTHNPELAAKADRIIRLKDGRIEAHA